MRDGPYLRVGHKGAAALAPENTLASLAVALENDVDMVEFDVVDAPDGTLVLGHSHDETHAEAPTLDEALAFLAASAPKRLQIDVDLKWHGFEAAVVDALERHELLERALVCSFFPHSLRTIHDLRPLLRTGISYPWDRRGLSSSRWLAPAVPACTAVLRAALPYRIERMIAAASASAAMLHHSVLSRATVERCHANGAQIFAWTIDDPALLRSAVALGVDGVVSNDPRIFDTSRDDR
jgi:glycerophosphoryl diester phosphodiesterase